MADYWIKAYHEILDDPKMATLPDRLWRRVMEIFLLAGRLSKDKDGNIPDTKQLAWILRMNTDDLSMDLRQLEILGIIKSTQTGWLVINFKKRQAASTDAERKKQQRERDQRKQYYNDDNVTELSRNVTQSTEDRVQNTESEAETDSGASANFDEILSLLRKLTGCLGAGESDINAINTIVRMGATKEDIKNGIDWFIGNGKIVRYFSSLVGPIQTAMSKRVQQGNRQYSLSNLKLDNSEQP